MYVNHETVKAVQTCSNGDVRFRKVFGTGWVKFNRANIKKALAGPFDMGDVEHLVFELLHPTLQSKFAPGLWWEMSERGEIGNWLRFIAKQDKRNRAGGRSN